MQIFNSLSISSVLLMVALGLSITFGIMGVINFAHGEFVMVGAYTTYVADRLLHDPLGGSWYLVALVAAFVVTAGLGFLTERSLIRFLYGRPFESILATWGLSLILQQLARNVFGASNVEVRTPDWLQGGLALAEGRATADQPPVHHRRGAAVRGGHLPVPEPDAGRVQHARGDAEPADGRRHGHQHRGG